MAVYHAYRFKELNAKQSPCGMNDLLASGAYANLKNFLRFTGLESHYRKLAVRGFREVVIFDHTTAEERVVARINLTSYVDFNTEIIGRSEVGAPYRYSVEVKTPAGTWVVEEQTHHLEDAIRYRDFKITAGDSARLVDESK